MQRASRETVATDRAQHAGGQSALVFKEQRENRVHPSGLFPNGAEELGHRARSEIVEMHSAANQSRVVDCESGHAQHSFECRPLKLQRRRV
jgi:hypothetical protein